METITTRYFEIVGAKEAVPILDALNAIVSKPLKERAVLLDSGAKIGLERIVVAKDKLSVRGQVVRIQSGNLPDEVHDDGLKKLNTAFPLGFGVAFVIDIPNRILAMEYDKNRCSPSRFSAYLKKTNEVYKYAFRPIIRKDVWEKFNNNDVKMFRIRLAMPKSFDFASEGTDLGSSIGSLAKAYESPYVNVELSVGRRKSILSEAVKAVAQKFKNRPELESMRARVVGDEEEIDLTGYYVKDAGKVEVDNQHGPDESYAIRVKEVADSLNTRREEIVSLITGKK